MSLLTLILSGIFLLVVWKLVNRKKGNFPKGPLPLPLLGNVLSFGKLPYLTFNKWANQYGRIYQVFLGHQRQIVLSDFELIKKAFQHPSLNGRPRIKLPDFDGGLMMTSGREWEEQRRFTFRQLRDFGLGKSSMEELILEEVEELLDWLKSQGNKSIPINKKFTFAVLNSLWRIVTGKRFSQTDPKLEDIFNQFDMFSNKLSMWRMAMILFMPKIAQIFPNLSGWNTFMKFLRANKELVDEPIRQHRSEFTKELQANPRDFIDAYLAEIDKTVDPESSFHGEVGEKSLSAVAIDLFQGGSIPTSTVLTWIVLYLVIHPEVKKKFQQEIDNVIGPSRIPTLADKPKMIYTEAVTCEILRKSSQLPTGIPHVATEDVKFEGYDIPQGSNITANKYYVHHDSRIWGDPDNFRPERFINSEGKIHMKEYILSFSTGKRVCPGESLARDEIFLFMTSLFQRFDIQADLSKPMPTTEPVPVLDMLQAPKFFVTLMDRKF